MWILVSDSEYLNRSQVVSDLSQFIHFDPGISVVLLNTKYMFYRFQVLGGKL